MEEQRASVKRSEEDMSRITQGNISNSDGWMTGAEAASLDPSFPGRKLGEYDNDPVYLGAGGGAGDGGRSVAST